MSTLTGSQAYGSPREDSDWDIIVLVTEEEGERLIKASDNGTIPVRFGRINLILCTNKDQLRIWRKVTHDLKKLGFPVSKEQARAAFMKKAKEEEVELFWRGEKPSDR